jgi:hypothetical protein
MESITAGNVRVDVETVCDPEGDKVPGNPRPLLWRYWEQIFVLG